jgi:hypothetical protein
MIVCYVLAQVISESSAKYIYPVVDFLSALSPAQSMLQYQSAKCKGTEHQALSIDYVHIDFACSAMNLAVYRAHMQGNDQ